MKIALIIGDAPNHLHLASRISEKYPVSSKVLVKKRNKAKNKKENFINKIIRKLAGYPLDRAWKELMLAYSNKLRNDYHEGFIQACSVNDDVVINHFRNEKPDLIIVSGTDLLKEQLINTLSNNGKIMNLHTGLSPYVKGGPNCTNWCLAEGQFTLIGNTIMWLDAGIDTGNIIASAKTPLLGNESLKELHFKVMEHAHDLYLEEIDKFVVGRHLASVPQDSIARGTLYLTKQWSVMKRLMAVINFKLKYNSESLKGNVSTVTINQSSHEKN